MTKPFSFAELAIDFDQRRVTVAGEVIDLTPTEYRLLETLALFKPNPHLP